MIRTYLLMLYFLSVDIGHWKSVIGNHYHILFITWNWTCTLLLKSKPIKTHLSMLYFLSQCGHLSSKTWHWKWLSHFFITWNWTHTKNLKSKLIKTYLSMLYFLRQCGHLSSKTWHWKWLSHCEYSSNPPRPIKQGVSLISPLVWILFAQFYCRDRIPS